MKKLAPSTWILSVLLAGTILHLAFRFSSPRHSDGDLTPSHRLFGNAISSSIVSDAGPTQVSKANPGKCGYWVVAAASCPVSHQAVREWTRQLKHDAIAPPEGWTFSWIVVGNEASADSLFGSRSFPLPHYWTADAQGFLDETDIRAYPTAIVTGQDGIPKSAAVGARLPASTAFGSNCDLAPSRSVGTSAPPFSSPTDSIL